MKVLTVLTTIVAVGQSVIIDQSNIGQSSLKNRAFADAFQSGMEKNADIIIKQQRYEQWKRRNDAEICVGLEEICCTRQLECCNSCVSRLCESTSHYSILDYC